MPLGARSKFMLLHYVGSQRAAKVSCEGCTKLEPTPQSLSIFCELVQKGFLDNVCNKTAARATDAE